VQLAADGNWRKFSLKQVMPVFQRDFKRRNKMLRNLSVSKERFFAVLPRFKWALLVSVPAVFFGFSVAIAQSSGDVPVTSTIRDYVDWTDPDSSTTQRIQMQVQSDGGGVYITIPGTKRNTFRVRSLFDGFQDWVLDTGLDVTSPTRKAFLDFSHPIAGSGPGGGAPTPPFTTALVRPKLTAAGDLVGINLLSIAGGETVSCPMRIGFFYPIGGSDQYRIHMTPNSPINPYPETDNAVVTCTGVDANSQCNQWQIEPEGTNGGCLTADCSVRQNVVKLVKLATVKGKLTEVNLGDFYMTFSIGVTNP